MKYEVLSSAPLIIRDFLVYSETIKNKSVNSVEEYFFDLRTFFRYLKLSRNMVPENTDFEEIDISDVDLDLVKTVTLNDLYSFLVYLKNVRKNNAKSRARKCSTLRIYFKYLTTNRGLLETDPTALMESPKFQSEIPKYLTLEESRELLNSIDGKHYERDYCIITLFLNCGLRLSELCNINLSDIKGTNLKITGKGNKQRIVHLNNACINALENYIKKRPTEGVKSEYKDALFLSQQLKRISNKTVQHIVYTFLDKSGLGGKGYSVHKLRHTAATLMYQHANVDVRVLQDILGHVNLNTTQIYTHTSSQQIDSAIDHNPLANEKLTNKNTNKENTDK